MEIVDYLRRQYAVLEIECSFIKDELTKLNESTDGRSSEIRLLGLQYSSMLTTAGILLERILSYEDKARSMKSTEDAAPFESIPEATEVVNASKNKKTHGK